jgi:hypothetical protein
LYSWIWRKLPGGLPGKLVGSVALSVGVMALLWFVVFPAVHPHMPWSNVDQGVDVEDGGGNGGDNGAPEEDATCVPGVDCQGTGFDPEDWQTAESPDGE